MNAEKPMPDSAEANVQGCACPFLGNGGTNHRGEGEMVDGVRSWTVSPACKIHGNPRWWMSTPKGAPK